MKENLEIKVIGQLETSGWWSTSKYMSFLGIMGVRNSSYFTWPHFACTLFFFSSFHSQGVAITFQFKQMQKSLTLSNFH